MQRNQRAFEFQLKQPKANNKAMFCSSLFRLKKEEMIIIKWPKFAKICRFE